LLDLLLVVLLLFRRGLGVRIVFWKEYTAQLGGFIFLLVGLVVGLDFLFRRIAVLLSELVEIEIAQRLQAQHAHDFSIRRRIFHACGFGGFREYEQLNVLFCQAAALCLGYRLVVAVECFYQVVKLLLSY
jgi:hypothetical protein